MKKSPLLGSQRPALSANVIARLAVATLVVSTVQISILSVELLARPAKTAADVLKNVPR